MEILKLIAPPTPLAIFSFFYPLPVKLKWNPDHWQFKLWKLIKEPKFEHFQSPSSAYFMTVFWLNEKIKQNIKGATSNEKFFHLCP